MASAGRLCVGRSLSLPSADCSVCIPSCSHPDTNALTFGLQVEILQAVPVKFDTFDILADNDVRGPCALYQYPFAHVSIVVSVAVGALMCAAC